MTPTNPLFPHIRKDILDREIEESATKLADDIHIYLYGTRGPSTSACRPACDFQEAAGYIIYFGDDALRVSFSAHRQVLSEDGMHLNSTQLPAYLQARCKTLMLAWRHSGRMD